MIILQIIWNGGEFIHAMLGTYDMAIIMVGFIFALLGAFLSAFGKVLMMGENKNSLPTADPSALQFVYSSRKARIAGSFIVVFVVLRIFAPSFTNTTLLIIFSFGVGFFNYLLTEWFINFLANRLGNVLPGLKKTISTEPDSISPDQTTKP